jgi:DNA-binding SARP family transcriptional activator/WD40 repeat protein/tRNA A-37 threonylcarbamoyl transferase component Bud32
MRIKVLGPVEVERNEIPVNVGGPQQRRLLALLVLQRGQAVSTGRLVDAIWPNGDAPDGAARSMRTYLSRLRTALPESSITTRPAGYVLDVNGAGLDLDEFDGLVEQAEGSLPDRALDLYDEALRLWRGDPFGEFADEWWALPEASRLRERRIAADLGRAEARMAMGHHNRAIPDLERLAAERPLEERPVALLMQALQATGRQAEALRVGRAFRHRLGEQTGLQPSPGLIRVESAIAAGADSTATAAGRPLRGYTLHEAIGEGTHGRVYAATQPGTERRVAVKVIRPDLADSSAFVTRFEAEAQLIARLEDPHIVPLYDYWREPGGAYLVFRLLSGGTARDSVISGGPWSLPRVSRLVEEIGGALIAAHAAGVVHNDVKSSNVLLDEAGVAYLSDFGIAAVAVAESGDVCDFGWLIWELLTGRRPPGSRSSVTTLWGQVPEGVDAVLQRATAGGYESVAELVLGWRAATGDFDGRRTPLTSDERRGVDSARRAVARQLALATSAGVNPYRGLRPFAEADAAGFHGRDAAIDDVVELVASHPLVTLVGSSGSGKSSVVHAGLVPRLRSGGDAVVTMIPGDDPIGALSAALNKMATISVGNESNDPVEVLTDLARQFGRVVLVIDQFEECWTRAPADGRDRFLGAVARSIEERSVDVRVVATVRADLLDRPLEHPLLGQQVGAGSYVLSPLSPAELDEAIVQPAARAGVTFEDGVVADLVAEAVTYPGSLPLLQFTLSELYDRRVDAVINRNALEGIGGMAGAIGRRADQVFAGLDEPERARELFVRLVAPGQGSPDTRVRARIGELSPGMRAVADEFVTARLLVTDRDPATREPTIEVAHEALLARWSRLAQWVDEDRQWLRQLQHLSLAARAWDESGRGDTELYRGARLELAIEALDVEGRTMSDLERAFVEAGRQARDADVVEARRTARRLRRRLSAVAAALVIAVLAAAVAIVQRNDANESEAAADEAAAVAEEQRAAADDAAAVAEEQRAAADGAAESAQASARDAQIEALVGRAESLRRTQRDTAALLAVEAHRLADTARTRSSLFAAFTDDERFLDAHRFDGERGTSGIVLPDGESAYLTDQDGRLRPYDLDTGALGTALPAIGSAVDRFPVLAASADGRRVVQASRSDPSLGPTTVGVVDTTSSYLEFAPIVVDGPVTSAAFLPDGDRLALSIGEEGRLVILDVTSGTKLTSIGGVALPVDERKYIWSLEPDTGEVGQVLRRPSGVAVSGDELLVGSADGSLRVFDAATFELRRTLRVAPNTLSTIRPVGDGTAVMTGRYGFGRVDLATGATVWRLSGQETCVNITVAQARGVFYCGDPYGRLEERDLTTSAVLRRLDAQNGNTGSLWTATDGTELVSFGTFEPIVSRWRLDGSGPITRVMAPGWRPWAFNHTGDRLLIEYGDVLDGDYANRVIDVESGDVVARPEGLLVPGWRDADTLGGGLFADDEIENAHFDLDRGAVVSDGNGAPLNEALTIQANDLDTGKEHTLFRYRVDADNWLARFDNDTFRPGPRIPVEGLVSWTISQSGHRIAAGTTTGVHVYDALTGEEVGSIPDANLRGVFITVTDQLFVSSLGGELVQYDLETLKPIRAFGGSRGHMFHGEGTADGSLIATSGGDQRVYLYDVTTGVRIGTPVTVPDGQWNRVNISLDGNWLTVGGENPDDDVRGRDTFQLWDLDPVHWETAACRIAGRNLTRAEWADNIGDLAPYRATCPDLPLDI